MKFHFIGWLQISWQVGGLVVPFFGHVQKICFVTKQSVSNQVLFLLCGCKFLNAKSEALKCYTECCDDSLPGCTMTSKVKQSLYRPGEAMRVPGSCSSQISRHLAHEGGKSCQPYASVAFYPRKYSWYSFLLEAESTTGPKKNHSFINSFHSIVMCRMRQFLAVLRSFFHSSLLCTFSCHLFLGLPLSLAVPKFIYNTLLGILFSSILCTFPNQRNVFNFIVFITVGFFNTCINFFIG